MILKTKYIFRFGWVFLSSILLFSILAIAFYSPGGLRNGSTDTAKPYFGISFNGNTTAEAKLLIDKTKDYTNLFVLQSGPISKNETAINMICDYAVESGLDVIVFFGWFDTDQPWQIPWLDFAKDRWGDNFLGVYLYDEPGGIQIDYNWSNFFHRIRTFNPEFYQSIAENIEENANQTVSRDYEEAKNRFLDYIINHIRVNELTERSISGYTSDYALYWFNYLAGYDTVFVELGWNHSTAKHIGLCRGAANVQQKDWGAIIVWKDREDDKKGVYKSGPEMLQDMLDAYETGAKYVIIFNYPTDPPGNPYGILTDEHFVAIQQFWNHMQQYPEDYGKTKAQAALVLPENYGW
ncbi:hypothetical protein KAS24_00035, partial [Candidatus Bathyarchaeota archaeon]|nr:hypothetical protein [Candidatus Bathyarchaeota archaeon]